MTADHWIQIATIVTASITTLTATVVGPLVVSRVNQPKTKLEISPQRTTAPPKRTLLVRLLRSQFSWIGLIIVGNICTLYFVMNHSTPLTPSVILRIAVLVTSIGVCIVLWFSLSIFNIVRLISEIQRDMLNALREAVRQDDPPQT